MPDNNGTIMRFWLREEVLNVFSSLKRKSRLSDWIVRALSFFLPSAIIAVVLVQPWYEKDLMFLDTITAAEIASMCCRPYYGLVSNLGIFLWVATSAICLFTALICIAKKDIDRQLHFALTAGVFTGLLALDDAFLVHERVLPSFGIPEKSVLIFHMICAFLYLVLNRRIILRHDFWLLAIGLGCFAISVFIDTAFDSMQPVFVFFEDGAKFVAIFGWFVFHTSVCASILITHKDVEAPG